MSIHVSEALDYSPKEISAGSYVQRLVNPENGQPALSLNSTYNSDFLLPNQVINLARSYLNFEVKTATPGAFNALHNGFLAAIDGIILSTSQGVRLVEMNNIPHYTKLVWRPETDLQEFLTYPSHTPNHATVADIQHSAHLFHPIRRQNGSSQDPQLLDNLLTAVSAYAAATSTGAGAALAAAAQEAKDVAAAQLAITNERNTSFGTSAPYSSAENGQTYAYSPDDYTAVASLIPHKTTGTAVCARIQLPLKMIYGSLLSVDKDLYFGEQLRLTIRWNQASQWGWRQNTSLYDVTAAPEELAAVPTLTNVQLKVAVETNDAIATALKNRVHSGEGLNINVPFTYAYKASASTTAGAQNTVIRKLNRGHGLRCLRMFMGIFSQSSVGNRFCNNNNYVSATTAGLKWSSYRCFVDSRPISDDVLTIIDSTAYLNHADKLKGSVIKSQKDWMVNNVIIEDFSGVKYSKDYVSNDSSNAGMDLTTEREFAFQFNQVPADALQVFMFAVCQKQLTINKSGVSLM